MKFLMVLALLAGAQAPDHVVSRLFAATSEGPFLTYSWGEHWIRLRGDLRGFDGELAAFACLGPAVFAGGSAGVFVSDDYGENYSRVDRFPGRDVTAFITARLFALEPTIFAGTKAGLYRSTDGGSEWVRVAESAIAGSVNAMAWPGPQFFVATDGGLFVSEDISESWSELEGELPKAPLLSLSVSRFFAADPKLFVGTRGAGLHRSVDGGERFEPVGGKDMASRTVNDLFWWDALLLVGTNDGLWLSRDGGESFEEVEELRGEIHSIVIPLHDRVAQSDVLVGTERGVYKSSDGGQSFRLVAEGIGSPSVTELRTFPGPPQDRERVR